MITPEQFKRAKYRAKAKAFKRTLDGYCRSLPDDLIDSTPDEDIKLLKTCLYEVNLCQIKKGANYGKWEATYNPDSEYHFKLEEII
jgi:hypothetical protein